MKLRLAVVAAAGLSLTALPGHSEPAGPPSVAADPALDLGRLEQRIDQFRRKEHSLERTLQRDVSEMDQLRKRIVLRGRAYYRLSRGLPSGDFMEHAVRVERLRQGLVSDMQRLRELRSAQKGADQELLAIRERRVPLEAEKDAAGRARDALLAREERDRAFEQAFLVSRGSADHTAVYAAASSLEAGSDFAALRGRLSFPLPGRAEIESVKMPYARGPGLKFKAAPGTPARSVFAGRVAFADEYAEYGRTVILDHGQGYFTVTAGLSTIEVRVGDELPVGMRLGLVTSRGPIGEIYFELRHQDETMSPNEWFGI